MKIAVSKLTFLLSYINAAPCEQFHISEPVTATSSQL